MLPVYDNLARALNAATEETRAAAGGLVEGVELTLRELTAILQKTWGYAHLPRGWRPFLTRICIRPCFEAPVPDYKAGQIIQVMAEGFMLHDQLLRPAHVGVSSTPA